MQSRMRLLVLRALAGGYTTAQALREFLTPESGSMFSYSSTGGERIRYEKRRRERREEAWIDRQRAAEEAKALKEKYRQLANALYELKTKGFVIERIDKDKKIKLIFSGKGKKLKKILEQKEKLLLPSVSRYQGEPDAAAKIISFDIPEKIAWKRRWLRSALHRLEFKMIHQSFWLGNIKLPAVFLKDLVEMKIFEYIEIFTVNKQGTLKKLHIDSPVVGK